MTPLTNQKLVEALKDVVSALDTMSTFHRHGPIWKSAEIGQSLKRGKKVLKEASAPLKEFAGLDKEDWLDLAELIEKDTGCCNSFADACRQIAEELSE